MAIQFADGAVLLSPEENQQLQRMMDKVEALYHKHQALSDEHRILKGMHEYTLLCKDAFEVENQKLKQQIKSDLNMQICKINRDEKALVPSNGLNLVIN